MRSLKIVETTFFSNFSVLLLIAVLSLLPLSAVAKLISYDDVDWETCGPNGISNRARLIWDERDFWVSQYVGIKMIIEDNRNYVGGDISSYCSSTTNNEQSRRECILVWQNHFKNFSRCAQYARQMCQLHGACR